MTGPSNVAANQPVVPTEKIEQPVVAAEALVDPVAGQEGNPSDPVAEPIVVAEEEDAESSNGCGSGADSMCPYNGEDAMRFLRELREAKDRYSEAT